LNEAQSAISIEKLVHRYPNGHEALHDIDLEISNGKVVALVGKNGAGKTTLAKHINALLRPTSGTVRVMGVDTSSMTASEMARKVGYVFQNPEDQLFESSVQDEVAFGPKNLGMNREDIKNQVTKALSLVGLSSLTSEHPYNLTYGQRKMLCIASILAMRPDILILDEPNAGQDYFGLSRLGTILEQLSRDGKTILLISHDMDFVATYSDEITLMHGGKVVAYGPTRSVLSDLSTLGLTAVRPPQVTRLAIRLSNDRIRHDIMTVDEMAETLINCARQA